MLVVREVQPGSATEIALQPGDILTRVNGKLMTTFRPLDEMHRRVGRQDARVRGAARRPGAAPGHRRPGPARDHAGRVSRVRRRGRAHALVPDGAALERTGAGRLRRESRLFARRGRRAARRGRHERRRQAGRDAGRFRAGRRAGCRRAAARRCAISRSTIRKARRRDSCASTGAGFRRVTAVATTARARGRARTCPTRRRRSRRSPRARRSSRRATHRRTVSRRRSCW